MSNPGGSSEHPLADPSYYSGDLAIGAVFSAVACRAPDARALSSRLGGMRYGELEARSNQLARLLAGMGLGPGDIAALRCARRPETIIAQLAVLKAGAAFAPLDPALPEAALAAQLEACAPRLRIGDGAAAEGWRDLGALLAQSANEPDEPPEVSVSGDDIAQIMFTSGTTGRPRGVRVRHRGVVRLVRAQNFATFGPETVFLAASPLSFDASTLEIWAPLLNGGRCALLEPAPPSVDDIVEAISADGVNAAWLTSGLFNLMVDHRLEGLRPLRLLFAGGDVLSPPHVSRALEGLPQTRLINGYGPTENATFTTTFEFDRASWSGGPAPIGRAIAHGAVHVLDDEMRPVEDGAEGFLWAAGDGVAAGYLDPEDTAKRFRPLPGADAPQQLMYDTGDVVRRRPDGVLEFVGRRDRQAKINGHRVEIDAVERAVLGAPGVRNGAVALEDRASGERRLRAFVVLDGGGSLDTVRGHLRGQLAAAQMPMLEAVAELPLTPQGKIDRKRLLAGAAAQRSPPIDDRTAEDKVARIFADVLGVADPKRDVNFFDLGGTSLQLLRAHALVQEQFGPTPLPLLFEHPRIDNLARALSGQGAAAQPGASRAEPQGGVADNAIAIIGMAGRFPGAEDVEAFWRNICAGADSITRFRPDEIEDAFSAVDRARPEYVAARGVLADADRFDAAFFGMQPREAALTDPQHRVFLETVAAALEDAGCDPERAGQPIGVFAGSSMNTYFLRHVMAQRDDIEQFASEYQLGMYGHLVGALADTLATRVAYKLDLKGPAATVQTACSTGLFVVAQAAQALLSGQCRTAVAGAVSITFPQARGYMHLEGGMGSRDGRVRPFDAAASGVVFGSGAGAVVLKRLADAIADGDRIHAVIRGWGVNNDGAGKAGFTAPSVAGQAQAIEAAIAAAGVPADTIGLVECHGTATPLGDPIEFAALQRAYGPGARALGSVKANIGHLDVAAGVAGLIKASLCVRDGVIPPLTNFETANPAIDLETSGFHAPTACETWEAPIRRAGVSAFGVGGTNVHVIIESPPSVAPGATHASPQLLPLSAAAAPAFALSAARLADALDGDAAPALSDVAHTLQSGRSAHALRGYVVARDGAQAAQALRGKVRMTSRPERRARLIALFPGQGAQQAGMAAGLYESFAAFRTELDRGVAQLLRQSGEDLSPLLLDPSADAQRLRETRLAQPALFIFSHALALQWARLGVRADVMVGHSVGELVAATIAGVMSFESAIELLVERGRLMQSAPQGAMLSVRLNEADVRSLAGPGLDIAAVNAPDHTVVAGDFGRIAALERALDARDVAHQRLQTSHAFHSRMMDDAALGLARAAAAVPLSAPRSAFVSTTTGALAADDVADPAYWARHCREPVMFAKALDAAAGAGPVVTLEIGPGRALTQLAGLTLGADRTQSAIASVPRPGATDSAERFLDAVGAIWSQGRAIEWSGLHEGSAPRRVSLPTYPFARDRHWIDAPQLQTASPPPSEREQTSMPQTARRTEIEAEIAEILEDLSGAEIPAANRGASFIELGFSSLSLGQVAIRVQRKFGLKIAFRQLLSDLPDIAALAAHIDAHAPQRPAAPKAIPVAARPANPQPQIEQSPAAPLSAGAAPIGLEGVFRAQLDAVRAVIDQQNALLAGGHALVGLGAPQPAVPAAKQTLPPASPPTPAPTPAATPPGDRFRLYRPGDARFELDPAQQRHLASLIARWNAKTRGSKAYADRHRGHLADPRSAAGFRPEWKDLVYPIVVAQAKGAYLTDIDGNRYIDILNGYGQTAFGHSPDFVQAALEKQLRDGYPIGPQAPLAGEVAEAICAMVGAERATFCNTGSEAVMAAMRIARAVTGRDLVVTFANDYHGQFDEVLVRAGLRDARALPAASGIPNESVTNMAVLPYGEDSSLEWIRANADRIAAVLVEPVQSRHPELRPFDFLRALRAITTESESALVFDEVVTGFRVHQGGMQAVTGVRADMATYGKVLGGGMPIGVLAGSRTFMDALDGGAWRFGDDSFPEVAPTFFAGTFVRHPLVLAACKATLEHMRAEGPALQERLSAATQDLVARINAALTVRKAPFALRSYASWFMVEPGAADPYGSLLFHHLRDEGIHIQEGFPCFLTTAHGAAEHDAILGAFERAVDALQSVGILGRSAAPAPASRTATAPLTGPQREILHAAALSTTASCAFNESVRISFEGPLDVAALEAAFALVVARHDALRARIDMAADAMTIAAPGNAELHVTDLGQGADAERALAVLIAEDARTPFDLANGPLWRARLFRTGEARHALVFSAHHIICDGWSMGVICGELAEAYAALRERRTPSLEAPLSFAAQAQAQTPADPSAIAFWTQLHREPAPRLELPTDRRRPPARSFAGATETHHVDAALATAVRKLGARNGATMFATLFGAFHALLARLTGEQDISIGIPFAGQSEIEGPMVGHLVEFLPLRVRSEDGATFNQLIAACRRHCDEAIQHRNVTFGAIVRALGVHRDAQRPPLTDVQFNFETFGGDLAFPGLTCAAAPNPKAAVTFDLFLNVIESSTGLRFDIDYDTDLFDGETIRRWLHNLELLLRAAVACDGASPADALDCLTEEERSWLATRNPAYAPIAKDAHVARAFAAVAVRKPARTALFEADLRCSYAELDQRSNQIAQELAARGVAKGDRVALIAHRGSDVIALLLGVLKLGAVYAPLDPGHPRDRLDGMIRDCAPRLAITNVNPAPVDGAIGLSDLVTSARSRSGDAVGADVSADDPAYVMYTSGSTGTPKGVLVPHRGILRLVTGQTFMRFGEEEVVLHLAPLAFDASTLEIWAALLHGGALAIAAAPQPDLAETESIIARHGVTTAWLTAPLFNAIVEERASALAPLHQLLIGGDVLSPGHVRRAQAALKAVIINGYGPTENTTFTACHPIAAIADDAAPIPIGAPIGGTRCHVVDSGGRLAMRGVVGELVVAGEGLALGYLNEPAGASSRFRTLPATAGERAYLTGDLVRWRADGTLEFLGRRDGQIKIRGRRVELGEIEAALMLQPGVGEAAAIVRTGADGAKTIEAFLTRAAGAAGSGEWPSALRETVSRRLAPEMVPQHIFEVARLPKTTSGKIDRRALAALAPAAPIAPAAATLAPQTATETLIAGVWRDVLHREIASTADGPFTLGADSLQIFKIAARLADAGLPIATTDLLSNPPLRELARLADSRSRPAQAKLSLADFRNGRGRQ